MSIPLTTPCVLLCRSLGLITLSFSLKCACRCQTFPSDRSSLAQHQAVWARCRHRNDCCKPRAQVGSFLQAALCGLSSEPSDAAGAARTADVRCGREVVAQANLHNADVAAVRCCAALIHRLYDRCADKHVFCLGCTCRGRPMTALEAVQPTGHSARNMKIKQVTYSPTMSDSEQSNRSQSRGSSSA